MKRCLIVKDTSLVVSKGNSFDINIKDEAMLNSNDIKNLINLFTELSTYLTSNLSVNLNVYGLDLNLVLNLKEMRIKGTLDTKEYGVVEFYFEEDTIYLSYNSLKLKGSIDEIVELLDLVLAKVNIDTNLNIDLNNILNNIGIKTSTDGLSLSILDYVLELSLSDKLTINTNIS